MRLSLRHVFRPQRQPRQNLPQPPRRRQNFRQEHHRRPPRDPHRAAGGGCRVRRGERRLRPRKGGRDGRGCPQVHQARRDDREIFPRRADPRPRRRQRPARSQPARPHFDGRPQRRGQNHHLRQARAPPEKGRPPPAARRLRPLPPRRHRAAPDASQAGGCPLLRPAARREGSDQGSSRGHRIRRKQRRHRPDLRHRRPPGNRRAAHRGTQEA